MKKLSLAFLFAAILVTACGSEPSVDSNSNSGDDGGSVVPPGNGGNGGNNGNGGAGAGGGGGQDVTPIPDGGGTGGGDQDGGVVDTDSGTGGGDQDGGTGGGGDQDSGSGGGDQDGGTTTGDGGSGGGGDQDAGTGGGGDQDSGSGGGTTDGGSGGGDQDSGSGGGTTDGGAGGGDQDSGHGGGDCTPHSCVLTQGYYKIHTVDFTGPSLTLGGVSYTQQEWVALLNLTPQGDDSVILAKQLIAALLNGGACDPNASATVQAAQDWMAANKDQDGRLPYGTMCVNPSDPGCTAYSLGQTLDAYNSGLSGTPHCN